MYAATILAMYSHFRIVDLLPGGWLHETPTRTLWDIYCQWKDNVTQITRQFMENYESFAQGRANSRAYAHECRTTGVFAEEGMADNDSESSDDNSDEETGGRLEPMDIDTHEQDLDPHFAELLESAVPEHAILAMTSCTSLATALHIPHNISHNKFASKFSKREKAYTTIEYLPPMPQAQMPIHDERGEVEGQAYIIELPHILDMNYSIEDIPWTRCTPSLTIAQTYQLWRLDPQQAVLAHLLSLRLLDDNAITNHTANSIVQGSPGTGKSTMVKAFVWFAFQHAKLDEIALCAYTWQAANVISLPHKTAVSTSYLFCIGRGGRARKGSIAKTELRNRLGPVKICFVDEYSFLDPSHLERMHEQALVAKQCTGISDVPFGGLTMVFIGDQNQLPPVQKPALYAGAYSEEQNSLHTRTPGRILWTTIPNVFILTQTHRLEENSLLHKLSQMFTDSTLATPANITELVQTLNAAYQPYVTHAIAEERSFRVVVPRNRQRQAINYNSARLIAQRDNKQLIVWCCQEQPPQTLTAAEREHILALPADDTEDIPAIGIFFTGIEYLITDSDAPLLKRTKNNICTGVMLYLDKNEPAMDETAQATALRVLKYPPAAIVVKLQGALDHIQIHDPPIPPGCIVISRCTRSYTPKGIAQRIQLKRTGIPLTPHMQFRIIALKDKHTITTGCILRIGQFPRADQ